MSHTEGHVRFHHGAWRVSISRNSKRIYRTVHAPDDHRGQRVAERELDLLIRQYSPGYHRGDITVPELMAFYLEHRRASWTDATYRTQAGLSKAVGIALPTANVRKLTHAEIGAAVDGWRTAGYSQNTIHCRVRTLKAALTDAVRVGMLDSSPAQYFRNPQAKPRTPPILDMAIVHRQIRRLDNPMLRMLALLALASGARQGEMLALQWPDIDLVTGEIRIAHAVTHSSARRGERVRTKTGVVHSVAIDAWTTTELSAWRTSPHRQALLGARRRTKWVFFNQHNITKPWTPGQPGQAWTPERDAIGLARLTLHDLRHIHATTALAAGVPVHSVAKRLGHTNPNTVMRIYGHAIPAHDQRIADVMGAIFEPVPK